MHSNAASARSTSRWRKAIAARRINAGYTLGMIHYTLGDFRRAIDILGNALRLLGEEAFSARFQTFYSGDLRVGLALSFAQLGRFSEGFENAEEVLRLGKETGSSHLLSVAHSALGLLHFLRGEYDKAIEILELGLEICDRGHLAVTHKATGVDLGRSYAYSGRADEGLRLIERTLQRAKEIQVYAADWQAFLGEAYLRAGLRDEARRSAESALDLSRARGQRGVEAECLYLLGEIAGSQAPPDLAAGERFAEAMARAEELGMRPLVARCHLSLGELERAAGRHGSAQRHLDAAATLHGEMGIRFAAAQRGD